MYPSPVIFRTAMRLIGLEHRLFGLKARLSQLEAEPTTQQRQEAQAEAQSHSVDQFWKLAEEEQAQNPQLTASQCRQQVLRQHPDLRAIYPRILS